MRRADDDGTTGNDGTTCRCWPPRGAPAASRVGRVRGDGMRNAYEAGVGRRNGRGERKVRDSAPSGSRRWVSGEMPRKPGPKAKKLIGEVEALLYIAPIPCSMSVTSYVAAAASRTPARRGPSG